MLLVVEAAVQLAATMPVKAQPVEGVLEVEEALQTIQVLRVVLEVTMVAEVPMSAEVPVVEVPLRVDRASMAQLPKRA